MSEDIINSIIYTTLDENVGPNPLLWYPLDLSEKIRMSVSIKIITMLTTDNGVIPSSLVIMPFPSFKLKGIIKYIEREDKSRRGKVAISSIALLFDEAHDIIFYKYLEYLDSTICESADKIVELETQRVKSDQIYFEINNLHSRISEILKDLQEKETALLDSEAFPQGKTKEEVESIYIFKIIVCGDPEVGKTSTILRFTDNAFRRTYIPTLGVNISEKNIKISNNVVKLILWDIAGQEKFNIMRRHFYKGLEAVILIFDLTNRKSFESIPNWYKDIKNFLKSESGLVGFILGNKEDLATERIIKREEALNVAKELKLEYIETSALTGKNVESSFNKVVETIIKSKTP
ncbi:MAG: Rab family GTPase [Promethearchaeota archaeon]